MTTVISPPGLRLCQLPLAGGWLGGGHTQCCCWSPPAVSTSLGTMLYGALGTGLGGPKVLRATILVTGYGVATGEDEAKGWRQRDERVGGGAGACQEGCGVLPAEPGSRVFCSNVDRAPSRHGIPPTTWGHPDEEAHTHQAALALRKGTAEWRPGLAGHQVTKGRMLCIRRGIRKFWKESLHCEL